MAQIGDEAHVLLRGAAQIEQRQAGEAMDLAEELLQPAAAASQGSILRGNSARGNRQASWAIVARRVTRSPLAIP